jgi:hypothetical protein
MKIVFSGYTRSEALTNFPVLVTLGTSQTGFSYSQFASPTGGDLRFTDASGSVPVFHEIDEWNTNGVSRVWVRLPVLASATNFIWACWGNPAATNPPPYATDGSVWTPAYSVVYHLKESGFPYADSTQQHPAQSGVAPATASGIIGQGVSFNGTSQYLDAGTFSLGNAFTFSAWVNLSTTVNNLVTIWANKGGGWNANGVALFVNTWNTTDKSVRLETGDGSNGTTAWTPTNLVSFGQWHLLTATVDHSAHLYVDGADATQSGAVYNTFANANDLNLGQITNGGSFFKGVLDEARIGAGICSSNWVWASWMTVASNTMLAAYSSVTQQPPVIVQPPQLAISVNGGQLLLNYPTNPAVFPLYTATNLVAPITWILATNQPVLVNTQWQIALPPNTNAVQFYRLQSQ